LIVAATFFETSRSRRHPRPHTNRANLADSQHMSLPFMTLRRIQVCKPRDFFCKLASFANLPRCHDTPWHCARTDIGCPRSRAKKCPLSRAGKFASSEKSTFFAQAAWVSIPLRVSQVQRANANEKQMSRAQSRKERKEVDIRFVLCVLGDFARNFMSSTFRNRPR
jgi:hypothetical protein